MTYASFESSVHSGEPVELIRFQRGLSSWLYTSSDVSFSHLSQTYEPYPFSIPETTQTVEVAKGKLNIKTPHNTPVVSDALASPLLAMMEVTIYRRHRGDAQVVEFWHGYVAGVQLEGDEATITCQQIGSTIKRTGRQRPAQRQCPHALFDSECGLTPAAWSATGTVFSISGAVLSSTVFALQPDGWWVGGMVSVGDTLRMVVNHVGDTVTLTGAVPGLAPGAALTAYAGCDHSGATCDSKFGNILNNGGLPFLPVKNPFVGDSAF